MPNSQDHSDSITLIISEVVEPERIREYQAWTTQINRATSQFDGFLGIDILQPRTQSHSEYVVIVKFDSDAYFKKWITSPIYQQWMEESQDLICVNSHQQLPQGIELKSREPSYYKQVILGVLSVYPLILLGELLLAPFLTGLHPLLSLLLSVTFVSALLTYPVMPCLTQLLNFWLHPPSGNTWKAGRTAGACSTEG
jgi:hypothetical protein